MSLAEARRGTLAEAQGVFLAEALSSRRSFWGGVRDIVDHALCRPVLSRSFSIPNPIPLCALASLREAWFLRDAFFNLWARAHSYCVPPLRGLGRGGRLTDGRSNFPFSSLRSCESALRGACAWRCRCRPLRACDSNDRPNGRFLSGPSPDHGSTRTFRMQRRRNAVVVSRRET